MSNSGIVNNCSPFSLQGIILVYDTTSMASFQGLIRWYNYITIVCMWIM